VQRDQRARLWARHRYGYAGGNPARSCCATRVPRHGKGVIVITPLLEFASVRAGYGRIDVLHGIDFELFPGEVFALLGPNGAGKSTTLAVASGQIVPSSGSLWLCGRDV